MVSPFLWSIRERVDAIAGQVAGMFNTDQLQVFFLDTKSIAYVAVGGWGADLSRRPRQFSDPVIAHAVDVTEGKTSTAVDVETGLMVVRHKRTPVVIVDLGTIASPNLGDQHLALAEILRQLFFQAQVAQVLEEMKVPVDFKTDRDAFLAGLGDLILKSSGAQFAALREIKEGSSLVCVDNWGFDPPRPADRLSFPLDKYVPFERAFRGLTVIERDIRRPGLESLAALPGLEEVRSFLVTPVHVGDRDFGVLSVAMSFLYDFPHLHQLGVEALANAVGVAVYNYRSFHGGTPLALDDLADLTMMATGVEVAQAARHEALTYIDSSIGAVANILDELPPRIADSLKTEVDELSESLLSASIAVDKIKLATKPPTFDDMTLVSLKDIWDEVVDQLSGRLDNLGIDHRVNGEAAHARVKVYRGWFRQVFLHLILNSADAFSGRGRGARKAQKAGRLISLTVDKLGPRDNTIVARYSDNATGISDRDLKGPDRYAELPIGQRVFAPNVTSKDHGSGWGLYLVRRVLDEHGGSIDLEAYRSGVTFRITLPRPR